MADDIAVFGKVIAADEALVEGATKLVMRDKIGWGTPGNYNDVDGSHPLPTAPSTAGDVATALTDNRKVVATPGTAVALRASMTSRWVTVTALKTNTSRVNVGGSGVSAVIGSDTGTPLDAGEAITIPIDDPAKVFIDARVAGEGVTFTVGA